MRVSKRLSAGFHRQGPDYRFDDQVDFDDIRDTLVFVPWWLAIGLISKSGF